MDRSEKASTFFNWLHQNGAHVSDKISIHDYSGEDMGFGIKAISFIKKGSSLFTIPRTLLLSRHSTAHCEAIRKGVDNCQWNQAIWAVALERRNPHSHWKPYFDMLPDSVSTPMSWCGHDKEMLKGSSIFNSVNDNKIFDRFMRSSRKINMEIEEQEFFFAGDLLSSYSFLENPSSPEDVMLVPVADLLNHSSTSNNAKLYFGKDCLEMIATKEIPEGSQIFNTFGKLSNSQLLLKYGFVESHNPYNNVVIELQTILQYLRDDNACLDRLYQKELVKDEYRLSMDSDSGLSSLFVKLKKSYKDFLLWQFGQYVTSDYSNQSCRQRMASCVCFEERQIIRYHLDRIL